MFSTHAYSAEDGAGAKRQYFNFAGTGIEALTYDDMEVRIDQWLGNKTGRSHHIACLNAFCVSLAIGDSRLREIYNSSDIAGPDGMPFVKWIRLFMNLHCDRFAAPDIVLHLAERARDKGYTFYLYGGAPDVLEKMKVFLLKRFPHINIVGANSPPFRALSVLEDDAICAEINVLKPDIILVGLGTPKQDYWIDEHLEKIRGSVIVASGATFDFFGGRIKMAPQWVRSSGFEWLYRLLSRDFKRLWKRYTYYNLRFLFRFLMQLSGFHGANMARRVRPEDPVNKSV